MDANSLPRIGIQDFDHIKVPFYVFFDFLLKNCDLQNQQHDLSTIPTYVVSTCVVSVDVSLSDMWLDVHVMSCMFKTQYLN